jgi:hypothetical protein
MNRRLAAVTLAGSLGVSAAMADWRAQCTPQPAPVPAPYCVVAGVQRFWIYDVEVDRLIIFCQADGAGGVQVTAGCYQPATGSWVNRNLDGPDTAIKLDDQPLTLSVSCTSTHPKHLHGSTLISTWK